MSGYDTDVLEWSARQADLLRRLAAGEQLNEQIDWPNVIDEVETVGRSERALLQNQIALVLEHLMKLQASPSTSSRNGWNISVLRGRRAIVRSLGDNPSLRPAVAAMIADEIPFVRRIVAATLAEHGEQPRADVASLTYTQDQVMGDWFPEA